MVESPGTRTHPQPGCTIIEILHLQLRKRRCTESENTDQPYFLPTAFFNEIPDVEILVCYVFKVQQRGLQC